MKQGDVEAFAKLQGSLGREVNLIAGLVQRSSGPWAILYSLISELVRGL